MSTMKLTSPPTLHYDLEARLWIFSIKGTRYLHLVLNAICVVYAFINDCLDSEGEKTEAEKMEKTGCIVFLIICLILMIASSTMVCWHCTIICCHSGNQSTTTFLKPIYEVIYYAVSGSLLIAAIVVYLYSHRILEDERPENYEHIYVTAGLAAFNVWMYMRNAVRLYILSTPI